MKKLYAIVLALLLTSCATGQMTNTGQTTDTSQQTNPPTVDPEAMQKADDMRRANEVTQKITGANNLFKHGDFNEAALAYQGILKNYSSSNGALECATRTNLCLTYLESGNRQGFKVNAAKLSSECRAVDFLSKETQFVLYLNGILDDGTPQAGSDERIDTRISNSLNQILKGDEK